MCDASHLSLQSSFLVSPGVSVYHLIHRVCLYHPLLCFRPGVQGPPSVFVLFISETLRFEADTPEGGSNGRKHQPFFLLQGFCCCTEPQMGVMSRLMCESSTAEEVYLMLPLSCGSSRTPESRVKGQILCVLPGTASLESPHMLREMRFVLPCTRRQWTRRP